MKHIRNLFQGNVDDYDDDVKFEETQFARCFIRGAYTNRNNEKSGLKLNGEGWKHMIKQDDMVSLVGLTGNGKSTLGATMYNILRGDKCDYFKASDSMNSFTKGIWSIKSFNAEKDKLTILDLQGLENDESVHQLLIVGMILSKALVFCSLGRFDFSMLKTVVKGFELIGKLDLKLVKPIMFLQIRWKQYKDNKIKLVDNDGNTRIVDRNGFIDHVKKEYPAIAGCDIRVFGLPKFDEDEDEDRFIGKYFKQVGLLVEELRKIDKGQGGEERVKYAKTVARALSGGSMKLVAQVNLFSFKHEIDLCKNESISHLRKQLAHLYSQVTIDKKITENEFIGKVNFQEIIERFKQDFIKRAKNITYYDSNENKEMESIITEICENDFNVESHFKAININIYYNQACIDFQQKNTKVFGEKNKEYEAFVENKIQGDIDRIGFWNMYATMSYQVVNDIETKKREIISSLNEVDLPKDFLNNDYRALWNTKYNTKQLDWRSTRDAERLKKNRVKSDGHGTCTKCKTKHNENVGHKKCGANAFWVWINRPTDHAVCTACNDVQTITGVCCWNCGHTLNIRVWNPK